LYYHTVPIFSLKWIRKRYHGAGTTDGKKPLNKLVRVMNKTKLRMFILPAIFLLCTVFYYFGELIDWAAWDALRANFFYGVHDIHRLLFLIPIVYAGYYNRVRGAIIITLISLAVFLPRAFFISPYPDPLLRMVIFTIFAGVIGVLVGIIRNQSDRLRRQ
jgi:ABC-type spermidine/putrescine transport system permease subunit I